ncbi:YfiR family protein [Vibrio tapetis subsp. quintayensis]|uniref:YfiR family protein n=1 Tax=Vibrio tapetis TaxID=52443 RepID=UPI0025B3CEC2|nr:YfiR family protein [Vibrio tapetis]MDN3682815.1 YfiR family protein [Vibrio tapetis subsp. quintayensis]
MEREYALKAGFLYNFARYSDGDWFDPSVNDAYTLCSPDAEFVRVAKQTLQGQLVKSRPVSVIQVDSPSIQCNSLFLTHAQGHQFVNDVSFKHTMLVGQEDGFAAKGGHINFFIAGGKIRFEVSPDNLAKAGIKLSAKVLRIGRIVDGSK